MKTTQEEKRIGRQQPTRSFILPYTETKGLDAVEYYNKTNRVAQEWQSQLICDMMAVNKDGLWTHTKFGYSLPRRNGKNEVIVIRELYGLLNGESIIHTAHRTTTSHSAWERLCDALTRLGLLEKEAFKTTKQYGLEMITMLNGDGRICFRTRSSKGGLGEGFDLLVVDEAQEYQDDQESALKYVVTDSPNPQTVFLGTPPTPVSSGTIFLKMRQRVLAGEAENSGWAEWSVDGQTDPNDREAWYMTNPSLGTVFTERSVADEVGTDAIDFNIQRLGLWIKYNQKSAISHNEWEKCKLSTLPKFDGPMFAGIKYNNDGLTVSMSIALRTTDDRIFVEAIDCQNVRSGTDWIINFLLKAKPQKVVVDGANGQQKLAEEMKEVKLKAPILPKVGEIIMANAQIEPMIESGRICHMGQPSLAQAFTNCEHRAIGSNGGYGYRSIKMGVDISLVDSAILAIWAAEEFKQAPAKQKVNY